jgi:hypothetical protein
MGVIEILSIIGGVCGSIITISTCATLILNKPKTWIKNIIKEVLNEESFNDQFKNLENKLGDNKEASLAALRHEIVEIYDEWISKGYLPKNVKKDLISLYDAYQKNGGNSFAKELYDELVQLETRE